MPVIMKPGFEIITHTPDMYNVIEGAARKCYLSEPKMPYQPEINFDNPDDFMDYNKLRRAEQIKFISDKIARGHHSILEHGSITVDFIFDRGVSHEEVRHRIQAISQESTRYCNYGNDRFDNEIRVILPHFFSDDEPRKTIKLGPIGAEVTLNKLDAWYQAMIQAEMWYMTLLELGATAQEARSVLPNSLKTEMRVTANIREWRHILKIRTEAGVHPQMAESMVPVLCSFRKHWPVLFDDIMYDEKWSKFAL